MIVAGRPLALLSALWLAASSLPAAAQVDHDGQLWINATAFGSVGSLAYFAEVQPRFGDGISRLDQLILRPAVGWKLTDAVTVYQGYARIENSPPGQRAFSEDRSFQQLGWEIGTFDRVKLSSRTRFEQRFQTNGRDTGFRLRQQLRAAVPLTEETRGVAAVAWTEAFLALNDTDWGARAGFDRIRTFVGLELPLAGRSTLELGYINQTVNAPASRVTMDHIVSVNVFVRQ
ncbi:DUF2490 domain-containing protein [Methylobacterium frigidaeris]|uniref:DUF2490 domain-containing protein n=1 Tax=Methylobacterium frigidaeris TaxID=2038277 RepID=A0AA37HEW7_9HYPH|nr:DUF2490 domain-containing protein [Methylobacterium frigidaeris]PIK70717.1 hypothetical protein CS379_23175 [Methylobacterium frigidaeris]GJD64547.1 hypothetical protein MPEAHAMD_4730 [Methylobacterium frigidaeris]